MPFTIPILYALFEGPFAGILVKIAHTPISLDWKVVLPLMIGPHRLQRNTATDVLKSRHSLWLTLPLKNPRSFPNLRVPLAPPVLAKILLIESAHCHKGCAGSGDRQVGIQAFTSCAIFSK